MKTTSTFSNAGWDNSVWCRDDGYNDGYPYLEWQNPSGTPLPVELALFEGFYANGSIILRWETATEVNNFGFDIERRVATNEAWEKIGFIQGSGTTNSPKSYNFTDPLELNDNLTCFDYRLKQIDNDGTFTYSKVITINISDITSVDDELKDEFTLHQNFPNPFNPSTKIKFSIGTSPYPSAHLSSGMRAGAVLLRVYNILGEEVATLVNEKLKPGNYTIEFDGTQLPSGMYFYKLTCERSYTATKKMMLVK